MKTATLDPVVTPVLAKHVQRNDIAQAERCDRCGAQAFVAVSMKAGGELLFCGHDFHVAEKGITPKAASILDQRNKINSKPMSGVHRD